MYGGSTFLRQWDGPRLGLNPDIHFLSRLPFHRTLKNDNLFTSQRIINASKHHKACSNNYFKVMQGLNIPKPSTNPSSRIHKFRTASSGSSLVFKVRRSEPELVFPARPTPNEVKSFSHVDLNICHRNMMSFIMFFEASSNMKDKDPAKAIKAALAEALVYYYPLAGRVKNAPDGRGELVVDCTAEGVAFMEADADVRLDEFGEESLQPLFPCIQDLVFYKATNIVGTIDRPLFAMQVTRLLCKGFIVTFTFSHVMADGKGVSQFVTAIADLARGAATPSLEPIWQRELLLTPDDGSPPPVHVETFPEAYPKNNANELETLPMTHRSFFFGPSELEALRRHIGGGVQCSTFDLIAASVFYSRTIALQPNPRDEARLIFMVDARRHVGLPNGYYGNASVAAVVACPARQVCRGGSLGYLVERVKKAKHEVTGEYARCFWEMNKTRGAPEVRLLDVIVSDVSRAELASVDFGWGKPVYAGTTDNGLNPLAVFIFAFRNGRIANVCLPADAMDRFSSALRALTHGEQEPDALLK